MKIKKTKKMKAKMLKYSVISMTLSILFLISCKAQSGIATDAPPHIENYTYGELTLKVIPFGLGKEISVGRIKADGNIMFNWPTINTDSIENSDAFMVKIKSALLGMSYCRDDKIEENTEDCKVVDSEYIYLFKDNKRVGVLFPATDKAFMDNEPANIYSNLIQGSSLSWFYSNTDGNFKGNCSEELKWEGKYNFEEQKIIDVQLKKGWNMVEYTLAEIEEFEDENGKGNLQKKIIQKTVNKIPENIKWHIKTFVKLD